MVDVWWVFRYLVGVMGCRAQNCPELPDMPDMPDKGLMHIKV